MRFTQWVVGAWLMLMQHVQAASLQDSITQNSAPAFIPPYGYADLPYMFNTSARINKLMRGDGQTMYLRWFSWDGNPSIPPRSYTSAFWVKVDEYSQLVIPKSKPFTVFFLQHSTQFFLSLSLS